MAQKNLAEISDREFDNVMNAELGKGEDDEDLTPEQQKQIESSLLEQRRLNRNKSGHAPTSKIDSPSKPEKPLMFYPYEIEHLKNALYPIIREKTGHLLNHFKSNPPLSFTIGDIVITIMKVE